MIIIYNFITKLLIFSIIKSILDYFINFIYKKTPNLLITVLKFNFKKIVITKLWYLENYSKKAFKENKYHVMTETLLIGLILYIVTHKRKNNNKCNNLSLYEKSNILKYWKPNSLVSSIVTKTNKSINITSSALPLIEANGKTLLNFISFNYLGLTTNYKVINASINTIKKYAVGSCGPRGFYGTMDIHLKFEEKISQLLSTKKYPVECVLYADYLGCPSSVIMTYVKSSDLIVADENVTWLFKQGFSISRAKIVYYKHNDLNDLNKVLQKIKKIDEKNKYFKLNRRFIVTETIFHFTGKFIDLPKLIELKNTFKYRLILDDSHGFGTIAKFGTPQFYNIETGKIDIYVCSMDKAIGSTGGFVVGDTEISEHQRLSSSGYVFSASGPPFQISGAKKALEFFSNKLIEKLQENLVLVHLLLKSQLTYFYTESNGKSPIIFLTLIDNKNTKYNVQLIHDYCLKREILIFCTNILPKNIYNLKPCLRLSINVEHSEIQLKKLIITLQQAEQIIL